MYLAANRFPQFVPFVRAKSNTRCDYFAGGDPERVTGMLRTGGVVADDEMVTDNDHHERDVVSALLAGDWETLMQFGGEVARSARTEVRRRRCFRWIDDLRDRMPRGDV
jgi:hypothetical protein